MSSQVPDRVLEGSPELLERLYARFSAQPLDWEWMPETSAELPVQTTIDRPVSVTGPGTYFGRAQRTLNFEPCTAEGWWFDRTDLPGSMPIRVAASNVWTTVRNIVLCSGSPHNYMRMVEHIVALKRGLSLDNLMIRMDSGDPPLFDRGSMDIVEALEQAGRRRLEQTAGYVTVREPVAITSENGSFLIFRPCRTWPPTLTVDCAVDFRSAIGQQRIRIRVTPETTRYGALARTNCPFRMVLFAKTIGKLFADVRNLGYTTRNILIHGRRRYFNAPGLLHEGKSLEAVWHRSILDLVAAISLIDSGRFAGEVLSYRAGHAMDVDLVRSLYIRQLLQPVVPPGAVPAP